MKEIVKIIGDSVARSSLGWMVEILSDDLIEYSEDGRAVRLEIEECRDAASPREWIIYWPAAWVWDQKSEDPISQKKRYEILDRIELAFWKLDRPLREII